MTSVTSPPVVNCHLWLFTVAIVGADPPSGFKFPSARYSAADDAYRPASLIQHVLPLVGVSGSTPLEIRCAHQEVAM